ncbi:hypothetical protein NDI85_21110 [Halomicroarcula sp. S1AR25-4]|uniref:hypothetical protein n=1 Tax=Haloarcula sp. S1AR25-4 TaxID=2950538 RepID=UPI002874D7D7|nr:hypothetical protein [Halomicroarcula sp. S1AR25-4]MDS0280287.1 hypothetical protein [Halomicroarcula sp. S1AR25-4]
MDQTEDDLVGHPIDDVPKRQPGDDCNARRTDDGRFVGYCNRTAGWGTDGDGGRCSTHGGSDDSGAPEGNDNAEGDGAPEDNTNAVTHALYVEHNRFYQKVITDGLRDLCDDIFEGYVRKYREVNGEPVAGEKARLSEIAVNQIKIIHSDNWAVDKPDDLESGNAFVDKETRIKTTEHAAREEDRYTESVVVKTQQRLRKEDRKWLKEMGLLGPDIDVAVDGEVDHTHEHGLDESTQEVIEDLSENLRA